MTAITSSHAVQTLGLVLMHFLWQGAAIALIAAGALALGRQASTRYATALVALLALTTAPIATAAWLYSSSGLATVAEATSALTVASSSSAAANTLQSATNASADSWSFAIAPWVPAVVVCWFAGVLVLSTRLAYGWLVVLRLRRHAMATVAAPLAAAVTRVQHAMGLRRHVVVAETTMLDTPAVIGWLRPLLLVPVGVVAGLSPVQLEAIVAHELAHVRRLDPLVNGLQAFVETVLFYHPAVWWVSGVLRREREFSSDDDAAAVVGDRVAYAGALAALEESRHRPTFALAASDGQLLTRVQRILGMPVTRQPPALGLSFIGAILVASTVAIAGFGTPVAVASEATAPQTPQLVATQTQLTNADAAFRNALQARSTTTLETLLADAFVGTDQNGVVDTRASLLARVTRDAPARIELRSINVQVADGMAIVTGVQMETRGAIREQVVFTRVWDRSTGTPLLISSTQFRDPRPAATPGSSATGPGVPGRTTSGAVVSTAPAQVSSATGPVSVRVGGDIKEPARITAVPPIYPQVAKAAQVQGVVILETNIDETGVPRNIRVLRGHPMLDQAAVDAVNQWRYRPTLVNGVPTPVTMTVTVSFSLADAAASASASAAPSQFAPPVAGGQSPLRVGGDVREPRKLKHVAPIYPQDAKDAGVSGVIIMEAVIDEGGRVSSTRVLRGIPQLTDAAVQAVRQWEYTPTLMNGTPVPVIMTITVNFQTLARTILPRIRFSNAPVRDLLAVVAQLTNATITFGANISDRLSEPHSIDSAERPLADVLTEILSAHGLTYQVLGPTSLLVVRAADR